MGSQSLRIAKMAGSILIKTGKALGYEAIFESEREERCSARVTAHA
jgi:hypothetical protein